MGSLSELIALAEHQDRVKNPWIGAVEKGVGGFMAGRQMRAQADNSRLDTTLKMLEIQEKMQKMEAEAQRMQFQKNMGEAMGFFPLDDTKKTSVTTTLFGMLGGDKNTSQVNTEMGKMRGSKMAELIKSGQAKVHLDESGRYSATFGAVGGEDSASLKFQKEKYAEEKADKDAKAKVEMAEKVSSLNYKFAQRHLYQQMITENPELAGEQTLAKVVPSDDLMASFTRVSELAATGKTTESDRLRAEVSKRLSESAAVDRELKDLDGEMWLTKGQKARKAELEGIKSGKPAQKPDGKPKSQSKVDPKKAETDFKNWLQGRKK